MYKVYSTILFLFITVNLFAGDNILWKDIRFIEKEADEINGIQMIYFHAPWCKWCAKFEQEVLSDEEIIDLLKGHLNVYEADVEKSDKIKIGREYITNQQLAVRLGVQSYPSVVFVNTNLQPVAYLKGYYNKEEFIEVIDYVLKN